MNNKMGDRNKHSNTSPMINSKNMNNSHGDRNNGNKDKGRRLNNHNYQNNQNKSLNSNSKGGRSGSNKQQARACCRLLNVFQFLWNTKSIGTSMKCNEPVTIQQRKSTGVSANSHTAFRCIEWVRHMVAAKELKRKPHTRLRATRGR